MLRLYRRHRSVCPQTSEKYRRCACPIYVEGTLNREPIRKALDLTSWSAAQKRIRAWEEAGELGVAVVDVPPVKGAVDRFLKDLKAQNVSLATYRKYDYLLLRRFLPWCDSKGLVKLRQLDVDRITEFRQSWVDSPLSASKNLERMRAFFRFCLDRNWVKSNPAKSVKMPQADSAPRVPFTQDEIHRILAACDKFKGNQDRMKAFCLVMMYSGLRLSDAVSLRGEDVRDGKIFLRTVKTGTDVWVPIPPLVIEALAKVPLEGGRYFWSSKGKLQVRCGDWSRALKSLFKRAKVAGGTSHRFRHTFITRLLSKGIPVDEVALLAGNSPKVLMKHYYHWITDRQQNLEKLVASTW